MLLLFSCAELIGSSRDKWRNRKLIILYNVGTVWERINSFSNDDLLEDELVRQEILDKPVFMTEFVF